MPCSSAPCLGLTPSRRRRLLEAPGLPDAVLPFVLMLSMTRSVMLRSLCMIWRLNLALKCEMRTQKREQLPIRLSHRCSSGISCLLGQTSPPEIWSPCWLLLRSRLETAWHKCRRILSGNAAPQKSKQSPVHSSSSSGLDLSSCPGSPSQVNDADLHHPISVHSKVCSCCRTRFGRCENSQQKLLKRSRAFLCCNQRHTLL